MGKVGNAGVQEKSAKGAGEKRTVPVKKGSDGVEKVYRVTVTLIHHCDEEAKMKLALIESIMKKGKL